MFGMEDATKEIRDNLRAAIADNPNAKEVVMHRLGLATDADLNTKIDAISNDVSGQLVPTGFSGLLAAGGDLMTDQEQLFQQKKATLYQALQQDVPDEKLRALFAEEAANKYVEKLKGSDPGHHDALKGLLDEEIPRKVSEGIDGFKAGISGELQEKVQMGGVHMPKAVADTVATMINSKIAIDPDALKEPLSAAMKQTLEDPGYLKLPAADQRDVVRANALAEMRKDDTFEHIVPGERIIAGIAGKGSDLLKRVGLDVDFAGATHAVIKDVATQFLAEQAADKAVPGMAKSPLQEGIAALHTGLDEVRMFLGAAVRKRDAGHGVAG